MTYKREYLATRNKDEFVAFLLERYKHLKEATAERRWYEYKKELGVQTYQKYRPGEKVSPHSWKMREYDDMKRLGCKITREELSKYGFKYEEINWMEDEGLLDNEK